ncbi:hypothetical protein [Pontiella sulfatireligans]|uniref:Transposase IS30-like HTH domain-containing protein n=1 Tax=Pontiella sulfatireligans TaxID=2750658 RepID=A0A6C2UNG0_9BACT|nr:hypothetical protein [Pontiella sulfatireligans]VGO20877.1 hypothetical protein SCARR_02944 [Pontiella sulfatireligans]
MEQGKGSTQTRKGKYLNRNERILIEGFLKAGMSESNIAKELERDRRPPENEGTPRAKRDFCSEQSGECKANKEYDYSRF